MLPHSGDIHVHVPALMFNGFFFFFFFFFSSFLHILSMDTDYSLYVYIIVVCTPMHAGLAATNILLIFVFSEN